MDGSAVAFVAVPAVFRMFIMDPVHVFVAMRFGQDAGGGDGGEFSVSFDHAGVQDFGIGLEAITIDQ